MGLERWRIRRLMNGHKRMQYDIYRPLAIMFADRKSEIEKIDTLNSMSFTAKLLHSLLCVCGFGSANNYGHKL